VNPRLFGLSNAYPLFVALGIVIGVAVVVPQARRERVPLWRFCLATAMVAWLGLTGAILYNLVEAGALHQFGWRAYFGSGLRYPGGLLAVAVAFPFLGRLVLPRHVGVLAFLDLLAPAAAIAVAVMRVGCFMMGCCYGWVSNVPWAISFPPLSQVARHHVMNGWIEPGAWSLPVHPLHVYLGLASLAVGVFLLWYRRRTTYTGEVVLLYLALHEGAKGMLEFMRDSLHDHSVTHLRVGALAVSALASAILLTRARGRLTAWLPARPRQPIG